MLDHQRTHVIPEGSCYIESREIPIDITGDSIASISAEEAFSSAILCYKMEKKKGEEIEQTEETKILSEHVLQILHGNDLLTLRQRQAIELYFLMGMTERGAAKVLGINHATLRQHKLTAIEKLRRFYREEVMPQNPTIRTIIRHIFPYFDSSDS